ncbi:MULTISPECIES: hypothetical protein [Bradyrhizobium]|uniref:hypothetical protein n=1 Tax=Bradyrhizobium TaxID=374 RepID=UPI0030B81B3E
MKTPAQRHGEFVADLAGQRAGLRELHVMGVGRDTPADQTGLAANEQQVGLAAFAPLLGKRKAIFGLRGLNRGYGAVSI